MRFTVSHLFSLFFSIVASPWMRNKQYRWLLFSFLVPYCLPSPLYVLLPLAFAAAACTPLSRTLPLPLSFFLLSLSQKHTLIQQSHMQTLSRVTVRVLPLPMPLLAGRNRSKRGRNGVPPVRLHTSLPLSLHPPVSTDSSLPPFLTLSALAVHQSVVTILLTSSRVGFTYIYRWIFLVG